MCEAWWTPSNASEVVILCEQLNGPLTRSDSASGNVCTAFQAVGHWTGERSAPPHRAGLQTRVHLQVYGDPHPPQAGACALETSESKMQQWETGPWRCRVSPRYSLHMSSGCVADDPAEPLPLRGLLPHLRRLTMQAAAKSTLSHGTHCCTEMQPTAG
ncbi:hypothetical protein BC628DRAFT_1123154 [Trametes gibbosa]|nr:hypothetical protein BC628DRAFT_1123154 [Trametes gibbosa]